MKPFPLSRKQVLEAEHSHQGGYALSMALEEFWRANGMRSGQNLTNGERRREALHWIGRCGSAGAA